MNTQDTSSSPAKARYIMLGGFLGAGKTTAVSKLARWLADQGRRVGLITNDQGSQLVDTTVLASRGFPVEEIPGGCFCCRFNSLVEAAQRLTAQSRPGVFIAEPVGSCTDLVATVTYPLRKLYGENFTIAPLSVLMDPVRALRVLGLESGGKFSDKVLYIYRKQLEEADLLVINKCDLLEAARLEKLQSALAAQFPQAKVFVVSARHGAGLAEWFQYLATTTQVPRAIMEVDYEAYADGEARLGWLNSTLRLASAKPFDGNQLLRELAAATQQRLNAAGTEVAHLKMTLEPESGLGDLAVVNLVRNDFVPELSQCLQDEFSTGELTINLRAEAEPESLREAMRQAVAQVASTRPDLRTDWQHLECFKPGKPQPTHRVGAGD
jgi:G3E family GTPase